MILLYLTFMSCEASVARPPCINGIFMDPFFMLLSSTQQILRITMCFGSLHYILDFLTEFLMQLPRLKAIVQICIEAKTVTKTLLSNPTLALWLILNTCTNDSKLLFMIYGIAIYISLIIVFQSIVLGLEILHCVQIS